MKNRHFLPKLIGLTGMFCLTLWSSPVALADSFSRIYHSDRRYPLITTPSDTASDDCINATILARLAIAEDPDATSTGEMVGLQQVLCTLSYPEGESAQTLRWNNGRNAKFGNNWYYPNGRNAKFGNNWYYPNGRNAKFGNNWYYPNGRSAKFGSFWYYPDGDSTDLPSLLSWSCGILDYFECQDRLNNLQNSYGFWYDLAVIELSSWAFQEMDDPDDDDHHSHDDHDIDLDIQIIIK